MANITRIRTMQSLHTFLVAGLFFVLNLVIASQVIAADEPPTNEELEQQLEQAAGDKKTAIYLELAIKNRNEKPQLTIDYGKKALEHIRQYPNDEDEVLVLCNMAWSYMLLGQYDEAEELSVRGLEIAEGIDDIKSLIVPLNIAGLAYWRQGRYDEALALYHRALDIARELGDTSGESATLNNIGLIYVENGDSPKAFDYFTQAKNLGDKLGDKHKMTIAMNNIAGIYSSQSSYSQALEVQLEVLKVREELNDEPGTAEISLNIGITYIHIGEYEKAHEYLKRALNFYEPVGDTRAISQTLNAMGLAYFNQEQYDAAAVHYDKALYYARQTNDKVMEANALISKTELQIARHMPEDAQESLNKAMALVEEIGLKPLEVKTNFHQAEIFLIRNQLDEALTHIQTAIELATEARERAQESDSYELLSRIYEERGEYQQALEAYRKHKVLDDDIFSQTNSDKLSQLQSLYEAEKRTKRIELLERDKELQAAKIQQQRFERNVWIFSLTLLLFIALLLYGRYSQRKVNQALSRALETQTGLMQAVAHEFRAPLARVQLGVDMLEELDDGDKKVFQNINRGLGELDSLLKEILALLKMESRQELEEFQPVIVGDLLAEQIEAYQPLHPNKTITRAEPPRGPAEFQLPKKHFEWILSNLISNAMNYSEQQVELGYRSSPSALEIYVDDDGPGIAKEDRDKIFEPFVRLDPSRTRSTGGTGLGLAIVSRLARLYRAEVRITTSDLGGSRFVIYWPLHKYIK
ncbi:tetratricopeptide repeat protein [Kangiella sediminilitoris]|uniref:histidine kinase n=1 Tax=Kangiella sediminilitoris TaxID=1144748 RepID=A0A1B3B9N5_9GAMM|nr:tetratricopeptide repeat protein [Kangiella sediminilitoris]AOE49531.1 Signal transduction histidine kinase-like protein [Kangiella sediminilitoris]